LRTLSGKNSELVLLCKEELMLQLMLRKILSLLFVIIIFNTVAMAQTKDEKAVTEALEHLRKAMVDADSTALTSLVLPQLSYGHSGGHVDDKAEFVQKIASGKSDFVTIDITEQNINIVKDVAVVRHKFHATTNDNGKSGTVDLSVLLIWQKQKKEWKLLARQAVKSK
jgi:ketosteroid isomerase-like protein